MTVEKVTGLWRCTARSCSSLPSRACSPPWKIFPFISMAKARQGLQGSRSRERRPSGLHRARASSAAGVPERCGPAPQRLQRPGGAHAERSDANSHPPAAAGSCRGAGVGGRGGHPNRSSMAAPPSTAPTAGEAQKRNQWLPALAQTIQNLGCRYPHALIKIIFFYPPE